MHTFKVLQDRGPMLRSHPVSTLDDRVKLLRRLVWWGEAAFDRSSGPVGGLRDPRMRQIGLAVTEACRARDDMCELQAVYDFVRKNVRYTGDIAMKDTFQSAWRTLQMGGGDCLPLSTLVMKLEDQPGDLAGGLPVRFTRLCDINAGDHIMADGTWTRVTDAWFTGRKQIVVFELSNQTALRCSPEHRLFLANGAEIRAQRVVVGDYLMTPRHPIMLPRDQQIPVVADGLRVVAIHAERHPELCMDITTEAKSFWLPESDVLVHNCDDMAQVCAVIAMENGFQTRFRITSNTGATWDHIYCLAGIPKHAPHKWIALDATLPGNRFNQSPPMAKYKDFPVDEMK